MQSLVRSRLIGCTILTFVVACFVGASSASADVPGPITTRVLAILDGAGSGTTGMYVKEVGGPVIAAHAENFEFAPASTIKVLLHLYAHDQVQRGNAAYTDQVNHYPGAADGCPKDAVADYTEDLIVSAERMMKISDNPATRANYEHWSPAPATINAYATSIGLTSTAFANSPGCDYGIANVDGNTATLTDYGRVYEGVADGSLLSGAPRDSFYENMNGREQLEDDGADFSGIYQVLLDMVEAEKPAGMPDELRDDFLEGMTANHKGGSYTLCSGTNCTNRSNWLAWAGWARFPTCESGSVTNRSYVWGAFIHGALMTGWTSGNTPAENAITAVRAEPLREQLRAVLAGWGACYPPDVTVTTTPAAPPAGQDGYFNAADLAGAGGAIGINVSATDDSGVTALHCTAEGSSVTVGSQAGTNPRTGSFTLSADGTHDVACTATDGMTPANTGASVDADNTVTVKIDATPPTVECQPPPPVFTWNGALGTVSATVTDGTSGVVSGSVSTPPRGRLLRRRQDRRADRSGQGRQHHHYGLFLRRRVPVPRVRLAARGRADQERLDDPGQVLLRRCGGSSAAGRRGRGTCRGVRRTGLVHGREPCSRLRDLQLRRESLRVQAEDCERHARDAHHRRQGARRRRRSEQRVDAGVPRQITEKASAVGWSPRPIRPRGDGIRSSTFEEKRGTLVRKSCWFSRSHSSVWRSEVWQPLCPRSPATARAAGAPGGALCGRALPQLRAGRAGRVHGRERAVRLLADRHDGHPRDQSPSGIFALFNAAVSC